MSEMFFCFDSFAFVSKIHLRLFISADVPPKGTFNQKLMQFFLSLDEEKNHLKFI